MNADLQTPDFVSVEVLQFAEANGVSEELPRVVAMTHEVFPGDAVRLEIEDDPEFFDRHITVFVQAQMDSVSDLVAAQWRWSERLTECCPAPTACVFRLATEAT